MRALILAYGLALLSPTVAAAATVSFADVIDNGTRTNFNGFEGLPAQDNYGDTYTEDGITVRQINGETNNIWTVSGTEGGITGTEGARSWYPNGGDNGYTSITLASGQNFTNVGLLFGNGWFGDGTTALWSLLLDGSEILSGSFIQNALSHTYISFLDGGFDEILLRVTSGPGTGIFGDGALQGASIDSIEIGPAVVPLPASVLLLLSGLLGLGLVGRRRA